MPMVWNADADAKLFAAVLATSDVKINYAAVAEKMGSECTAKAIIHRIGKIKETARKVDEGNDSAATTPAKTPAKRGRAKATLNGTDGAEETDSPAAKRAKTSATANAQGKANTKAKAKAPSGIKGEPVELDSDLEPFKKEETEEDSNDNE